MPTTPNLSIVHIEQNQDGHAVTVSEGFDDFDGALAGEITVDLTGATSPLLLDGDVALRAMSLRFSNGPGAPFTVQLPVNTKLYLLRNTAGHELTIGVAGGNSIALADAEATFVFVDGTDLVPVGGGGGLASLGDIGDVTLAGLASDDVIAFDGAGWVNLTPALYAAKLALLNLKDVAAGGIGDGQVLAWVAASSRFQAADQAGGGNATRLLDDAATADGIETDFALSAESNGLLEVYVDGIRQDDDGFSVVTTTLTFASAPPAGAYVAAYDVGSNGAAIATPYDLGTFIAGTPLAGELVLEFVATRSLSFPNDFAGSQLSARTAATGTTVFDLQKNGASAGTITVAASGTTGTFATGVGAVSLVAGDRLAIVAEDPADATLADISITLKGTRTS